MRTAGIICECNPFHGGHERLIRLAREDGVDAVVCLMSGCFVQRGECAVADPYLRAEIVQSGGADLVLELPFPYSSASADYFALAGVRILTALGVEELWFGSECGDLSRLMRLAEIAESDAFFASESAPYGSGTATSYFERLSRLAGERVSDSPNDILAISYLRAIRREHSPLRPVAVKREGAPFGQIHLEKGIIPSAAALRAELFRSGQEGISAYLPAVEDEIFRAAAKAGTFPADPTRLRALSFSFLRTSVQKMQDSAELGGGLFAHLAKVSLRSATAEKFFASAGTKRYTDARIRRGLLYAMTGTQKSDLSAPPAYTRLLAAGRRGRQFLAMHRRQGRFPVVIRRSDLPNTRQARRLCLLEERGYGLFVLCLPKPLPADSFWRRRAKVEKED